MSKFIYLYRGPAGAMSAPSPEQAAERGAAFAAWMEKVGDALIDVGAPFGAGTALSDDGTEAVAGDLLGYSILEADDFTAAKRLTDDLPFMSGNDGLCAVEIFELMAL